MAGRKNMHNRIRTRRKNALARWEETLSTGRLLCGKKPPINNPEYVSSQIEILKEKLS